MKTCLNCGKDVESFWLNSFYVLEGGKFIKSHDWAQASCRCEVIDPRIIDGKLIDGFGGRTLINLEEDNEHDH